MVFSKLDQPVFVIVLNILLINAQDVRLRPLNVNKDWITLSGFSSGGTFAQQLQFSYSSLFSGLAVFSHGFYRCGPGDGVVTNYDNFCTTIGGFPVERLWDPNRVLIDINQYAKSGLIEDPRNLRNKKLYVYSGTQNVFFTTDMSLRILNVYEPFIGTTSTIKTRVQNANYTMPTNNFGGKCTGDAAEQMYISNCGFSGAYESLNWLLGSSAVGRSPGPDQFIALQHLIEFDQTEFSYGIENTNMDTTGFLYIPENCLHNRNKCFLHIYFHGCFVGREFNGDGHVKNTGFLEVAELNSIIILFPQAKGSLPQNMIGCWDTYGIAGPLYATQRGAQVRVVKRMIDRLLGEEEFGIRAMGPPTAPYQEPYQAPYQQPQQQQPFHPAPYLPPASSSLAAVFSPKYVFPNLAGGYAK